MKKDKAWLKGLINEEGIAMDMNLLGRHDEQYWKNENIKINKGRLFYLIDQLDEPEVLSQEWIDENSALGQFITNKVINFDKFVKADKLQNLLVPKQEEVDRAYKDGYEKGKKYTFYKVYLEGLADKESEPETVADVLADFNKSLERLKKVLGTKVEETTK